MYYRKTMNLFVNRFFRSAMVLTVFMVGNAPVGAQYKAIPDCDSLRPITLLNQYVSLITYGPFVGPGKNLEISGHPKTSKHFFEQEHHTCWYRVNVVKDGKFVMTITPVHPADDYDFLVFVADPGSFCAKLKAKKILPVRSNLARGDSTTGAYRTGLSHKGNAEFVGQGRGNPFSKPLEVKKGQTLFIVVDNVKSDRGCTIEFGYLEAMNITGKVEGEKGGQEARIELSDHNGDLMYKGKTAPDGTYKLDVLVWQNTNNTLIVEADSMFPRIIEVNTSSKDYKFNDLRLQMQKLKKGKKYPIGTIQFNPGMSTLLQGSYPNVKALAKLMLSNPKMTIRIEGHIHGGMGAYDETGQKLSEERAKRIYNFLLQSGVKPDRMSTIGHGAKFMLYPHAVSEWESQQNRRVEINVISLDGT